MELPTALFRHEAHFASVAASENLTGWIRSNHSCAKCHEPGEARGPETAKPCLDCHRKDMKPAREIADRLGMASAAGYREAMHRTCRACHEKERDRVERPELADCATCHRGHRPLAVTARQEPGRRPPMPTAGVAG
jgi:hypothetical protein